MTGETSVAAVRAWLLDHVSIQPCHITGTHDPTHTVTHLCSDQKAAAFDRLLAALSVDPPAVRRELHPNCGWCHDIPSQEHFREGVRLLHQWAGVPVSDALAAPANDAPRPGDDASLLDYLIAASLQGQTQREQGFKSRPPGNGWRYWGKVIGEITADLFPAERASAALKTLTSAGWVEQSRPLGGDLWVRPAPGVTADTMRAVSQ